MRSTSTRRCRIYWDNGGEDDGAEQEDAPYPKFKPEELAGEWKSMPAELTYRIFNLQTKTTYAAREISSAAHQGVYGDHDEFYEDRQRKFGDLTEEAILISDELRALAKLPARETRDAVWDPVKMFKRDIAEKRTKQLQQKAGGVSG